MAYEVTKLVHGRAYRYQVRSERDPATGKFRNRWTYLGRAEADGRPAAVRVRRDARTALLDALGRLFERDDPDAVTAAAIAAEARLATGTFYRYFRSKQDAIAALVGRMRDEDNDVGLLERVPGSRADARAALRAWSESILRKPQRYGAVIRALYVLATRDEQIVEMRRARRELLLRRLAGFLALLIERGYAELDAPEATAWSLGAFIEGTFREAVQVAPLSEARIAASVDLIDRAVFGRVEAPPAAV